MGLFDFVILLIELVVIGLLWVLRLFVLWYMVLLLMLGDGVVCFKFRLRLAFDFVDCFDFACDLDVWLIDIWFGCLTFGFRLI